MQLLLFILPIRLIMFANIQKNLWIQTRFAYFSCRISLFYKNKVKLESNLYYFNQQKRA